MKRFVTVHIGEFAVEALVAERGEAAERIQDRLVRALGLYMQGKELSRPGWAYPTTQPQLEGAEVKLELEVDDDFWRAFEQEAERQDVTVSKLASYAALHYVAKVDAERVVRRVVDRLGDEDPDREADSPT